MMTKRLLIGLLAIFLLPSCEQPDPVFNGRDGDVLTFSGRKWDIKHSNSLLGPGPNFFTDHPNDVFIDDKGYLHLSVMEREGVWRCTEVVSQDTMGYGTYVFTIQGNPVDIDRNIVLGLFTWDNNTFQTQANSEVDIEFAKWGDPDEEFTLQYGVQPIAFGNYYAERVTKPTASNENWIGVSTHAFTWTDSIITWQSWDGPTYNNGEPDASWTFDLNNPARVKEEGGKSSDPIIIPAPGNTTNARMNLWLVNGPEGPHSNTRHEIVIQEFQYIPF